MGVSEAQVQPCLLSLNVLEVIQFQLNFPSLVFPRNTKKTHIEDCRCLVWGKRSEPTSRFETLTKPTSPGV